MMAIRRHPEARPLTYFLRNIALNIPTAIFEKLNTFVPLGAILLDGKRSTTGTSIVVVKC